MLEILDYRVFGALPPLLVSENGMQVKTPEDWQARREELYRTAVTLQYGTLPPPPEFLEVETLYQGSEWSTYRISSGTRRVPVSFVMRVLRPTSVKEGKFPVIVDGDGCFGYFSRSYFIDMPYCAGIGLALFDRTEIVPDDKGASGRTAALYRAYPEYDFGAVGAWAWGYSRCVDALIELDLVDPSMIAFTGHSRGGKTAMLAGVCDNRATVVNPVETCAGSCSCYRTQTTAVDAKGRLKSSEMLSDLMSNFGFWMGKNMYDYVDCPQKLPFDAHFLKALVAPRTLFVAEAAQDVWANPVGSWQTTVAARKAYELLGADQELLWYYRDGGHDHAAQDVEMLVNLMLHKMHGTPLSENFFRRPFEIPDQAQ